MLILMYLFKPFESPDLPSSNVRINHLFIGDVWINNMPLMCSPQQQINCSDEQRQSLHKMTEKELEAILINILYEEEQKKLQQQHDELLELIKTQEKKQKKQKNMMKEHKQYSDELMKEIFDVVDNYKYTEILPKNADTSKLDAMLNEISFEDDEVSYIRSTQNIFLTSQEVINLTSQEIRHRKMWESNYVILQKFIQKHDSLPTKTMSHYGKVNIYVWVFRQKMRYRNKTLRQDEIEKLESLKDWTWKNSINLEPPSKLWVSKYKKVKAFVHEKGEYPEDTTSRYEKSLINWIQEQKMRYINKQLKEECIELLTQLPGWSWSTRNSRRIRNL